MTQPPGGVPQPPYTGPPRYGPPPGYGWPPAYAPPPPPPRRSGLLPWLIVGGAAVLAGLGVLVAVLLDRGGGGAEPAAVDSTSSAAPSPADPSGTPVDEPSPGEGRYPGSAEVAQEWVEAMEQGEFQTAFDLSCAQVQASAEAVATEGNDPAWELGTYFFEQTLGGVGFTDWTFEGVEFQPASGTDLATFTLAMDDGQAFPLQVYVVEDGTVCDFR